MSTRRPMGHRRLGRAGLRVSEFGLGGWLTFGGTLGDTSDTARILQAGFEAGVNFFDIADVYARGEAEKVMGKTLATLPRHRLVISSKCYWPMSDDVNDRGLSRKHVMESVERSLKRLGTDYLDLYFCHRFDADTPLDETARAMDDLVHQGKVLYWGTSEWTGSQIREVRALCEPAGLYAPSVEQPQFNLVERAKVEVDVRPAALEGGMGLVTWSPLASGLLTGKYDKGIPEGSRLAQNAWLREGLLSEKNLGRMRQLKEVAGDLSCSTTQLALAWTAAQPGISSVILGVTSLPQLEENLGALAVTITPEISARLDAIFPPG